MDRQLKLSMAVPISTKSVGKPSQLHARQKQRRQRQRRMLCCALLITFVAAGLLAYETKAPLAQTDAAYIPPMNTPPAEPALGAGAAAGLPVADAAGQVANPTPSAETSVPAAAAGLSVLNTPAASIDYGENTPILYYAQSGDSMGVLAVRFGVETTEITSADPLPAEGFIPEGQLLLIPDRLDETSANLKLFPDSEVVNSPSAVDFDVSAFVSQAGGYLATYQEFVYGSGMMSGAAIIEKVAREFSIHPRLLLTLIEYESGWVYDMPQSRYQVNYPLGINLGESVGLYHQLEFAAGVLGTGYYGWREGTMMVLVFPNGEELRLAAELNCGSVGLMYYFAQQLNPLEWQAALYAENSVFKTYQAMFGDPWLIAQEYEPLFTPNVVQPDLILPFDIGVTWSLTVGPHAAWGAADVRAALDFAPPSSAPGCETNYAWVNAAADGLVVRSWDGTVVIDLDGDGFEQTGWNLIYLHMASFGRVAQGTWVKAGDHLGHPSCEGGIATGNHLHLVRKYNGEWVPAEGPLTFNLQGWKAKAGSQPLSGWLVKGDQIVRASVVGGAASQITRAQ